MASEVGHYYILLTEIRHMNTCLKFNEAPGNDYSVLLLHTSRFCRQRSKIRLESANTYTSLSPNENSHTIVIQLQ